MELSSTQILELLKSPKNKAGIQKAIDHEDHLRFHADIVFNRVVDEKGMPVANMADVPYYQKYIQWVSGILTASDKMEQFQKLLTFPLRTNELVDDIADEYVKVFDAQDSFFIPGLSKPELESDFLNYLDSIDEKDFWKGDAFKAMMSSISSIMIVDLSPRQLSQQPEPYFYLLDIRSVHDIKIGSKGNIEYILFSNSENNFTVLDSAYYRVYTKQEGGTFALQIENPHDLGYCPARFFWSDEINKKNPEIKHSPISALLTRLDWYLFFETAKESLDIYAAYPIYWAYSSKCDYKTSNGDECQNGLINVWDEKTEKDIVVKCPVCESKRIVGPGSLIEKPIPRGEIKLEGAPAGIIGIDKDSLEYNVNEAERLKAQIIAAATGKNKLISKEAVNEDQVASQFESQTNVLRWIADNYAKAHRWIWDTVGRLRYGDSYVGSSISYGSQFYLQTMEDAVNDFKEGKESGLPGYLLISKISAIEHLTSKNNPKEKQRIDILKHLEPYPFLTLKECKESGFDVIDKIGYITKANFANFVSKFEQEYGSIVDAGSAFDFSKRINLIQEVLKGYAKELMGDDSNSSGITAGGELGKIPLAIQQMSLAWFRADQSGDTALAALIRKQIVELTTQIVT